jgi:antitoxin HicB
MVYPAVIEKGERNYSAFAPDVPGATGVGTTREATLASLAQGLALVLQDLSERGLTHPQPTKRDALDLSDDDPEEPYELAEVAPAPINPVSLEIERAIDAAGLSEAEVARRMGTSRAAMTRITDPFYWGQSLNTLNKLAKALNAELSVHLEPKTA